MYRCGGVHPLRQTRSPIRSPPSSSCPGRARDDGGEHGATSDVPHLVDWDVAVATARRLSKPGPAVSAGRGARRGRRPARAGRHRRGSRPVVHRAVRPVGSAPVIVVDRPGWVQANASAFDDVLAPLAQLIAEQRKDTGKARDGSAMSARVAGVQVGRPARVPLRPGARAVRPVLRTRRAGSDGCCSSRPTSSHVERELDVDPARLPDCGCACTRRPTACSSPRCRGCASYLRSADPRVRRRDRGRPGRARRAAARGASARSSASFRGQGEALAGRAGADPEAARDPRPPDRADVAARGSRRVRHGRRRAGGRPVASRTIREQVHQAPRRAPARSTRRSAGCSGSR